MFASLLRPRRQRRQIDQSPFPSPFDDTGYSPWTQSDSRRGLGHAHGADVSSGEDAPSLQEVREGRNEDWAGEDEGEEGEEPHETAPLLPIFTASYLGMAAIHPYSVDAIES